MRRLPEILQNETIYETTHDDPYWAMGRLLGVQIFFATSPAQSVVHYPQKSHSFNENDLSLILAARSKVVGVL